MNGVKMVSDFKDFLARGNVMDMAVGIIIGAAFTAIVTSMVADLVNPVLSLLTGGVDFSSKYILLSDGEFPNIGAAEEAGAAVFAYGRFIMAVINFMTIGFVVFLLVRWITRLQQEPDGETEEAVSAGPTESELLMEIRDLLKK